jgi:hypothetical protein
MEKTVDLPLLTQKLWRTLQGGQKIPTWIVLRMLWIAHKSQHFRDPSLNLAMESFK